MAGTQNKNPEGFAGSNLSPHQIKHVESVRRIVVWLQEKFSDETDFNSFGDIETVLTEAGRKMGEEQYLLFFERQRAILPTRVS